MAKIGKIEDQLLYTLPALGPRVTVITLTDNGKWLWLRSAEALWHGKAARNLIAKGRVDLNLALGDQGAYPALVARRTDQRHHPAATDWRALGWPTIRTATGKTR